MVQHASQRSWGYLAQAVALVSAQKINIIGQKDIIRKRAIEGGRGQIIPRKLCNSEMFGPI